MRHTTMPSPRTAPGPRLTVGRALVLLLVLAAALALMSARLIAQTPDARVVVPDLPGGAVVAGCYQADRGLYGPYPLTFCLAGKGSYKVRGDGLRCDGRLNWRTEGRDVAIRLLRQSCNRGLAWAEGNVTCRPRSLLDVILSELLKDGAGPAQGRVVVPDAPPAVRMLRCTYTPTVKGQPKLTFVARRL